MNHVYRLDHGGKVCSGDYFDDKNIAEADPANALTYLFSRGYFLWVLLVLYWIALGLCVCVCCVAVAGMGMLMKGGAR